jgi:transposase
MDNDQLKHMFESVWPHYGERERRLFAAAQAIAFGYGGISLVERISGLSRVTIYKGIKELADEPFKADLKPKKGVGRPSLEITDPTLEKSLLALVDEITLHDYESPLIWTYKSTRTLAQELREKGHNVSHEKVAQILKKNGYSLQNNTKTKENADNKERELQFKIINDTVKMAMNQGQPIFFIEIKKKEIVDNFENINGQQVRKIKKNSLRINEHNFPDQGLAQEDLYGICNFESKKACVNIETDYDVVTFTANSISGWLKLYGHNTFGGFNSLLIIIEGGLSNSYLDQVWKGNLQKLADNLNISLKVFYFPPGTRKWSKNEYRLFSFVSSSWREEPLYSLETAVWALSSKTTFKELEIKCRLDRRQYLNHLKTAGQERPGVFMAPQVIGGDLNYTIYPKNVVGL